MSLYSLKHNKFQSAVIWEYFEREIYFHFKMMFEFKFKKIFYFIFNI